MGVRLRMRLLLIAALLRITSYNVCYTKLLRPSAGKDVGGDRRGHLVQGRVAFHGEQFGDRDRTGCGDATEIVAYQINDHQVFGPLSGLRITSYNVCYTKLLRVFIEDGSFISTSEGCRRSLAKHGQLRRPAVG